MTINTFVSGVNESFSSELNENFSETRHLVTRGFTNSSVASSSSTWADSLTVSTPAATKASQTVFLDATVFTRQTDGTFGNVRLYDDTGAAQIVIQGINGPIEADGGAPEYGVYFLQGTVTLTNVSDTKSIKLQVQQSSGDAENNEIVGARLTCMLVES